MSLLQKCTHKSSRPTNETFPTLPQITTALRLILGLLYGTSLGIRDETRGITGVLFGLNVITFLPMLWFKSYLEADVESYKSLNFVGVVNGFGMMLLVWILIFTSYHQEEEGSLGRVIEGMVSTTLGGSVDVGAVGGGMQDEF